MVHLFLLLFAGYHYHNNLTDVFETAFKEGQHCKDWMKSGNSLAVQWLGLCASTAGGTGSIPSQGTKVPHAAQCSHK